MERDGCGCTRRPEMVKVGISQALNREILVCNFWFLLYILEGRHVAITITGGIKRLPVTLVSSLQWSS